MCNDLDVPGTREQKFVTLCCGFLKRSLVSRSTLNMLKMPIDQIKIKSHTYIL